ncbi:MAG TPA: preprotein translocase subunit SecA [Candidatus Ornithospirochaeta avicola]|uniref:Protein translocase subunit SecA n=1 Tax=Candidatus Ornithospirochaeta avicola TaxID=2840896 RepID=A0A9D1PRD7_9SPIO|nr:preprotein translocase subunit SecA [Candidatus Ornithospirochaeta avicola]
MANFITALFGGSKHERDMKKLYPIIKEINSYESWAEGLSESDMKAQTARWKKEIQDGSSSLDQILAKAYAMTREAARRTLNQRHYDVQMMGAVVLHQGKIMELKTGEGKTLACTPAAYLNALSGKGVNIVTVNEYLAERDKNWMEPVYSYLGLTVGCIKSGMDNEEKKKNYESDITYGTNNEFGFDYLRDNMKGRLEDKVQKNHAFCIVDEIDSILIDEARTPLIISGPGDDDTEKVRKADSITPFLKECEKNPETGDYYELTQMEKLDRTIAMNFDERGDYRKDEKSKKITFTKQGMTHMEELLKKAGALLPSQDEKGETVYSLYDGENFEMVHYVTQALTAHVMYQKDVDYIVKDGEVQIVDEFTGRVLPGRRYSDGLHQAIEAKEHVKVLGQSKTYATITFQNFFRMYEKLSGMTGTADTEAAEFNEIYGLDVVVIPTNRPVIRKDYKDKIYYDEQAKFNAIVNDVKEIHKTGQPILIGTVSIEKSETLSKMLTRAGIRHEVLNAKNHAREAYIIGEAGAKGAVTIATNMAGRGTDIKLGGSPEHLAYKKIGTDCTLEEFNQAMKDIEDEYKKRYEEVKALGGLYIIGSERHESRRIDNQLRGRSGRQGDPGSSRFYVSLSDPLMRLFARDGLREMIGRLGLKDGEAIEHRMLDSAIEKAQEKVEARNFDIRKHLLEYDNVLNEQRNYIYAERDKILSDENLSERILSNIKDIIAYYSDESGKDREKFVSSVTSFFNIQDVLKEEELYPYLEKNIKEKEAKAGKEQFNAFIRYVYLRNIDKRWIDHLDNLEELKESAGLMSYAQKNPLVEYKNTASDAFDEMITLISDSVVKTVVSVKILSERERRERTLNAQHKSFRTADTQATRRAESENTTIRRTSPKIGRNDPCPCGSGKKYKNCCGRNA